MPGPGTKYKQAMTGQSTTSSMVLGGSNEPNGPSGSARRTTTVSRTPPPTEVSSHFVTKLISTSSVGRLGLTLVQTDPLAIGSFLRLTTDDLFKPTPSQDDTRSPKRAGPQRSSAARD